MSTVLPFLAKNSEEQVSLVSIDEGLSNVDAQRIMAILSDAERKMALLDSIPSLIDKKVTSFFDVTTISLIQDYQRLEEEYKAAVYVDTKKKSTKLMLRHLFGSPAVLAKVRQFHASRSDEESDLLATIGKFKMIMYQKLKISVEQEQADQQALEQITASEKKTRAEIELLSKQLEDILADRRNVSLLKNTIIQKLKDELRDVRRQTEDTNRKMDQKAKVRETNERAEFQDKEAQALKEIADLEKVYAEAVKKHRDEEANMRKRKAKVEAEIENWLHKYDSDMTEKQNEIDELMTIYNDERAQLDELSARFKVLKGQYEGIMDEKRELEEKRRQELLETQRLNDAATKIQAFYRGWVTRRRLKNPKAAKAEKPKPKKGKK